MFTNVYKENIIQINQSQNYFRITQLLQTDNPDLSSSSRKRI